MNPYKVIQDFEKAIAKYTGAKYAIAVSSCTEALMLACAYYLKDSKKKDISIPKHTYVGVPMSIIHAGGKVKFRDENWMGLYKLEPSNIWDAAKWLTSGMYKSIHKQSPNPVVCISLHWAKTLSVGWGGVILHNNKEMDTWLRRARFDGRTEGVHPSKDTFDQIGWHCIMSPAQAAEALTRLSFLPKHNLPIPADGYPDLSQHKLFQ